MPGGSLNAPRKRSAQLTIDGTPAKKKTRKEPSKRTSSTLPERLKQLRTKAKTASEEEEKRNFLESSLHFVPHDKGRAWCTLCQRPVSLEHSVFFPHVTAGKKHRKNVATILATRKERALPEMSQELADKCKRAACCELVISTKIPAYRLRNPRLRGALADGFNVALPHHGDMYEYVPVVSITEKDTVKQELAAASAVTLIHDGATVVRPR